MVTTAARQEEKVRVAVAGGAVRWFRDGPQAGATPELNLNKQSLTRGEGHPVIREAQGRKGRAAPRI